MKLIFKHLILYCFFSSYRVLAFVEPAYLFDSPQSFGRGGTGVTSGRGYEGFFYNPALLYWEKSTVRDAVVFSPMIELSNDLTTIVKNYKALSKLSDDEVTDLILTRNSKNNHASIQNFSGIILKNISVGVVNSLKSNIQFDFSYDKVSDIDLDYNIRNGIMVGAAREIPWISEDIKVGIVGKYLYKDQWTLSQENKDEIINSASKGEKISINNKIVSNKGFKKDVDLGFLWQKPGQVNKRIGFSLVNILNGAYTGSPNKDANLINFGGSVSSKVKRSTFTLSMDIFDLGRYYKENYFRTTYFGFEWKYQENFGAQFGLHQGYPTYGVSVGMRLAQLSIARYTKERGGILGSNPDPRDVIQLKIGWML